MEFESVYSEGDASEETTKEVKTLQQEAASLCQTGTINTAEDGGDEPPGEAAFQAVVAEERYWSSGEGSGQEGWNWEDRGEEGNWGKQLTSAHSGEEGRGGDRPPEERGPLPPGGDGNTRVRNEEQGETESDEMSYFWRVPEHGSQAERTEDDQEETGEVKRDSEREASRREDEEEEEEDDGYDDDERSDGDEEEEDNGLSLCFEQEGKNPHWDSPAEDTLDFPELAVQHQQDFIAGDEESAEKMKDFSGEEHQEAGESFAEFPSDFSSCEDTEDGETDEDGNGQRPGFWDSRQRVMGSETPSVGGRDPLGTVSGDGAGMSSDTSDSSSDDESQTTSDEEPEATLKGLENKRQLEERPRGSRLFDDLFAAGVEGCPGGTMCPAEDGRASSGSLDDSFFFSKGPRDSPTSEEFGDDEKSNWEQEQERIRAFNAFYADSDQLTGEEGRRRPRLCSNRCRACVTASASSHRKTDKSPVLLGAAVSGHRLRNRQVRTATLVQQSRSRRINAA